MTDPISRAYDLLDQQDVDGAIALLANVQDADAAGLLGDLLLERAQMAAAAEAFTRALAADPMNVPWLRGLVAALVGGGQREQAMASCRRLLELRSDDAVGHRYMAALLLAVGERDAALDHAREARFLAPRDLDIQIAVAGILSEAGEGVAAVEILDAALRQAHAADPALSVGWVALARIWLGLAEPEKARKALAEALSADPDDAAGAKAMLDQLGEATETDHLPPAFVRALFDTYADRFDRELVGKLRYDAPGALRALLLEKGVGAGRRVLDAGCGTGLAGVAIKDMASYLAGFDLSPRMVDKAKTRNIYDVLWVGELVDSMQARPAAYDLVLAADVLVYVGDLAPVMAAAAATLMPSGLFAFTCERTDLDGFILHEGRRFAHGEDHIRSAVRAAGLDLLHLAHHSTRIDRGQPVPGWIALAQKA